MNEFINSIANDGDQQLKVLSVLGSACLGKTTLARVLYNRMGKQYSCRAFIRVSKKPDMKRIFRDMLSQLQRQHPPQHYMEIDLIHNIKRYLQDKRYLIIINHVFPKGNHGSRIITTTQIQDVALACCSDQLEYVFEMKPLDDDHSRKLFFNRLYGSESYCPEQFKEDLNEIVALCGGSPLATISIASLLASQPAMTIDLLRYICESLSSLFSANPTSEITRQALSLSLNNLPYYLKTCLIYLSMCQEGYTFCKDDLVKQWMAEGFIDATEGQDIVKVAESYLDQLIGRRFIQPIHINYNNEVLSCAVHDAVHDLITHKSAEENFIVAIDYSQKNVALSHKARRVSLLFSDAGYAKTPANIVKPQVRSLRFSGLFDFMPCITEFKLLRVLNLQLSCPRGNEVDLTGISELFQLKYLKIACDVRIKLPNRGLNFLETLDIKDAIVINFKLGIHLSRLLYLSLPLQNILLDRIDWTSAGGLNYLQEIHLAPFVYDLESSMEALKSSMEALGSLIGGHGNLKTMVVARFSSVEHIAIHGASKKIISWDDLAPPLLLQRFEFSPHSSIIFSRIPMWVKELSNLRILKIAVREIYCLEILKGLPTLTALSLYLETAPLHMIVFDTATEFSVLKYFKLTCTSGIAWLKFEADAMPTLWKLKLVFNANPRMNQHQHGTAVIVINHMPSLKEVSVKFGGTAADVEYALRTFVSNHPSNPTINMQQVDYSSYGEEYTTQKHQQDEIMEEEPDEYCRQKPDKIVEEEPDEYDKTLERQADKRITRPPESSSCLHVPGAGDGSQSIRQDVNWEVSCRYPPEWVGWHEFSLDELMSATSNFSEENFLGKDIFGPIYKGTIDGSIMVAITKLTYGSLLHPESMHHPHMVRLLGYCHQDMHNIYVYEYMPRGSLKQLLEEPNLIASLPWLTRLKIALGAAKGLSFLHESASQRLCGEFSASSILLASDYTAKLWGFGRVKQYDVLSNSLSMNNHMLYFGVVLLELLAGKRFGLKDLTPLSNTYLRRRGKLHHIMDPGLEGQYSLSAAWSIARIARQCLQIMHMKPPSMCDIVDTLEPLLSDDRNDGQSKKTNWSRWGSSLTRYGAAKGRGRAAKQAEEAEGPTTTGASSVTLPMRSTPAGSK